MFHKSGFLSRHFLGLRLGILCSVAVPFLAMFYPVVLAGEFMNREEYRLFGRPQERKSLENICLLAFVILLAVGLINFVEATMLHNSFGLSYSLTMPILWFGEWALLGWLFFTQSEEEVNEEEEEEYENV